MAHKEKYPDSQNGYLVKKVTRKGRVNIIISIDPEVNSDPIANEIPVPQNEIKNLDKQNIGRHKLWQRRK